MEILFWTFYIINFFFQILFYSTGNARPLSLYACLENLGGSCLHSGGSWHPGIPCLSQHCKDKSQSQFVNSSWAWHVDWRVHNSLFQCLKPNCWQFHQRLGRSNSTWWRIHFWISWLKYCSTLFLIQLLQITLNFQYEEVSVILSH